MLARAYRLTSGPAFTAAARTGARAGSPTLVVHLLTDATSADDSLRVGFVVSKAVGPAVRRNRVKRRLRHLVADRLAAIPAGVLVVRALPAAAEASYPELGRDLDRCLQRVMR